MKKICLITFFAFTYLISISQNVGVGIDPPIEKLDVNGNLNVRGNLKLNGVAGTSGQVLGTDASGNTSWIDYSQYNHYVGFLSSGTILKPAGVTELLIEAWGGGGGGAYSGGGGAGSYTAAAFVVPPAAATWNISIGIGGSGASTTTATANGGATTQVQNSTNTVSAVGGLGATQFFIGDVSAVGTQSGAVNWIFIKGNPGKANSETYGQYAQTPSVQFYTAVKYGDGGTPFGGIGLPGSGGFFSFVNGGGTIRLISSAKGGIAAGGGGGSFQSSTNGGASGGDGYVIFRWKE